MNAGDRAAQDTEIDDLNYASLNIVEALPHGHFAPEGGEEILRSLRGVKILRMGSPEESGLEGGGLIIDYCHDQCGPRRLVLSFNERAMWVEFEAELLGLR